MTPSPSLGRSSEDLRPDAHSFRRSSAEVPRLTAERVAPGRGGEGLRGVWHGGYDIGRHSE